MFVNENNPNPILNCPVGKSDRGILDFVNIKKPMSKLKSGTLGKESAIPKLL